MVRRLRAGDAEPLLRAFRPMLRALARRKASQCVEDALQEAEIALWWSAGKCDLSKPETVKAFIVKSAVNAIHTFVEKFRRFRHALPGDSLEGYRAPEARDAPAELPDHLMVYVDVVRENGGLAGMHRSVADRLGIRISTSSARFHREARRAKDSYVKA